MGVSTDAPSATTGAMAEEEEDVADDGKTMAVTAPVQPLLDFACSSCHHVLIPKKLEMGIVETLAPNEIH